MAIFSIRNFAIKRLMRTGDDGIMKMPSQMKADFAEAMLTKQLIDAGIDPRLIKNEQQLINVLDGIDDMKKKMAEMATKEKTGITSAKVMDMEGKEIPKGSKIMGGKATETEAEIAARMNKENKESVARMKNKKLIDDAIDNVSTGFVRGDNKYNAELVAEEIALKRGLNVDDLSTRERADIYGEAYESLMKKMRDESDFAGGGMLVQPSMTGKRPGYRGDAAAKSSGAAASGRVGGSDVGESSTKSDPRDDGPDDRSTLEQTLNQRNIVNRPTETKKSKSTLKNLYNTSQDLNYLRNLMIGNFPGIGKQLLFDLGKRKFFDDQTMLDEEGIINGLPENQFADVSAMDIRRKGQLKNVDYQTAKDIGMINPTMTEQEFEGVKSGEITEPTGQFIGAKGGRVGLKDGMDRRTFLKIMGGLASIPVLGKFFKGAKVASKAAPVAMESATRSEAPTYFLKLVDKITKQGKPVTSTEDIMETYIYTAKNGDTYELVNDLKTGDLRITKDKTGVGTYGDKSFDTIEDRTVMEYKAPRQDVDVETGRGTKEAPEYEEYKVEFDADGTEADATIIDELVQKEIIEESASEAPSIKKAEGGRVGLLSGGGILRTILTNLAKDKGISPSEYLRLTNYKALPNEAKRIMSKDEFLKLKADMTEKRIQLMDTVKEMIVSRQNFEKSKADLAAGMNQASPGYGDKAVEMMFPPGSFKSPVPAGSGQKDVMMMEQLIKNLKTKDRQLNASGGVAYMLGE